MAIIFTFSSTEKKKLFEVFREIPSPYFGQYLTFRENIRQIIKKKIAPSNFFEICQEIKKKRNENPTLSFLLKNCPIDVDVPIFDQAEPLKDKYKKKITFVAESFLELFSQLTESSLLAYRSRENGDFFLDIYPQQEFYATQSLKSKGELIFHNDRTYHLIRPDYINLLGMRELNGNLIYTGYLKGDLLLKNIPAKFHDILRKPLFYTSYDVYSIQHNPEITQSLAHPILQGKFTFRYADTLTKPLIDAPLEAYQAIIALKDALVLTTKERVLVDQGCLYSFSNTAALHNREIIKIIDESAANTRWLMKTYSFANYQSRDQFKKYYEEGVDSLVMEDKKIFKV